MKEEIKKNKKRKASWILTILAIIALLLIIGSIPSVNSWFKKLFSVITPFLIGLLIAYILYLPCKKIETLFLKSKSKFLKKRARGLSVTITYVIFILLIVLIINCIFPILKESIMDLIENAPTYYHNVINAYHNLPDDSVLKNETIQEKVQEIENFDIKQYLSLSNDKLIEYLHGIINIFTGLFDTFVAIVVSVYILLQRTAIISGLRKFARAIFKKNTYEAVDKYFIKANEVFFTYISSQLLDAIVVGIILTIAMLIMKVKYAPLLGFMIGLFNLIPYFGAIFAVIIAVIITFMTGGWVKALITAIVITILQQIDANIINPKIVGGSLKVSPLLVIISVTVFGAYFGVIGMLIGVPIAVVIKTIIGDWTESRNKLKDKEE